jgi:hypothetical protein
LSKDVVELYSAHETGVYGHGRSGHTRRR